MLMMCSCVWIGYGFGGVLVGMFNVMLVCRCVLVFSVNGN